jgi:hypothetical protein
VRRCWSLNRAIAHTLCAESTDRGAVFGGIDQLPDFVEEGILGEVLGHSLGPLWFDDGLCHAGGKLDVQVFDDEFAGDEAGEEAIAGF